MKHQDFSLQGPSLDLFPYLLKVEVEINTEQRK